MTTEENSINPTAPAQRRLVLDNRSVKIIVRREHDTSPALVYFVMKADYRNNELDYSLRTDEAIILRDALTTLIGEG